MTTLSPCVNILLEIGSSIGIYSLKKATINDVADLAKVSIKTVSRVLNHEPKVRPSTKERVQKAMEMLEYSPNSSARRLAGNRAYLLGLLYDDPGTTYISNIQIGALKACRNDHYDILIFPCSYKDASLPATIAEMVSSVRVDGVLLTPPLCDLPAVRDKLHKTDAPHVVISPGPGYDSQWKVLTNDRQVCARMVHHLAELGHSRIAFVRGASHHHAIDIRFKGYLDGMAQCGLKVRTAYFGEGDNSFESGMTWGHHLLDLAKPPTAIFCANDDMAAGVMKAAHQKNVSIPRDLSVAGFDDVPLASQTWPSLTTIRQPTQAMAEAAANLLIGRIRGNLPENFDRILESELVIRSSTGPAPEWVVSEWVKSDWPGL